MKTITTKEANTRQGFIQDDYAAQKNKNRRQFGELIKEGMAKPMCVFHGHSATDSTHIRPAIPR